MTAPSAVGVLREVVEAARVYFNRYCVDEAEDTFDPDEQHGEETGCTRQQHKDAKRLRDTLTQADAALASLEAAEGVVVDDAMVERAIVAGCATLPNEYPPNWPADYSADEQAHGRAFMRAAIEAALAPPAAASDGEG